MRLADFTLSKSNNGIHPRIETTRTSVRQTTKHGSGVMLGNPVEFHIVEFDVVIVFHFSFTYHAFAYAIPYKQSDTRSFPIESFSGLSCGLLF